MRGWFWGVTFILWGCVGSASTALPGRKITVTFLAHGFKSKELKIFEAQAQQYAAYLLSFAPFRARASQFKFQTIASTSSLKCKQDDRSEVCNLEAISKKASKTLTDIAAVIVNNGGHCGSGSPLTPVVCNGEFGKEVFVHEFGHSFAGLQDEYIKWETEIPWRIPDNANCFPKVLSTTWPGILNSNDVQLGCTYPHWYRSSANSIMRDLSAPYFNPVSEKILQERMDFLLSQPLQKIQPTLQPAEIASQLEFF